MAFGFPASSTRTQQYDADPIIMKRLVRDAFEKLGWSYKTVSEAAMIARVPMGIHSYGERVTVSIGDDGTITARSKCWPMQLFDWGKNKQNLDQLFLCLIGEIRNSALLPLQTPAAFDEFGKSPVERICSGKAK